VREMALVEGGLEGLIMGVTEEAIEFPSLGGALDFFLGKVLGLIGMQNGRTVAPGVPEIPVRTAVA